MAPPELPGMYYDSVKGKYFRIQPDHRAPQGAAHSQSAVKASKEAAEVVKEAEQRLRRDRLGRIQRMDRATYTNLSLHLRHGGHKSKELLARNYAGNLSVRRLSSPALPDHPWSIEAFTTTPSGRLRLLTTTRAIDIRLSQHDPRTIVGVMDSNGPTPNGPLYRNGVGAHCPMGIASVHDEQFVCFVDKTIQVILDTHHVMLSFDADEIFWDITANEFVDRVFPLASNNGVRAVILEEDHMDAQLIGAERHEQMVVAFQEPNIVMSGTRSGLVNLCDFRADETIHRIQHSSGIQGLTTGRTSNHIITSGFTTTCIYDLRYTKALTELPRNQRKQRKKSPALSPEYHASPSQPFVSFNMPRGFASTHYACGKRLAYLRSLDLAIVTNAREDNCQAMIYNASTGQIVPSPMSRPGMMSRKDPLSVNIGRVRDGPESIFLGGRKALYEWNVDIPVSRNAKVDTNPRSGQATSKPPGTVLEWSWDSTEGDTKNDFQLGEDKFPPDSVENVAQAWKYGNIGPVID